MFDVLAGPGEVRGVPGEGPRDPPVAEQGGGRLGIGERLFALKRADVAPFGGERFARARALRLDGFCLGGVLWRLCGREEAEFVVEYSRSFKRRG